MVSEHKRRVAALEAADWFVRFGAVSRQDRKRYLAWLKQSPLHVAETLRLQCIYQWLRSILVPSSDATERVGASGSLIDSSHSGRQRLH
jgi:ferric-dicitrate binding protein FerR (iron transport regulator)